MAEETLKEVPNREWQSTKPNGQRKKRETLHKADKERN